MNEATLLAIDYKRGKLRVLDQLLLPHTTKYELVNTIQDGHHVIKSMKVRGAPAIAIVAALSLAVELEHKRDQFTEVDILIKFIEDSLEYLKTSRPTAVNLFDAAKKLKDLVLSKKQEAVCSIINSFIEAAEFMLVQDVQDNKNIGMHGAEFLLNYYNNQAVNILTHCNTGSLATAGYGTALGVIRYLQENKKLNSVYCTETRPYNQGSRLTSYELVYEKMNATLICDSMATALIAQKKVDAIVVGADRVTSNGDTANKIGTYQLAIIAHHFNIPFLVAAPTTSIDLNIKSGDQIPIEERNASELTKVSGLNENGDIISVQVGHKHINVWNPAFDVTPANLITAIVTEKGVIVKEKGQKEYDLEKSLINK